jgi:hypothetical protein
MWMKPKIAGQSVHVALRNGQAIVIPPEGRDVPDMFQVAARAFADPAPAAHQAPEPVVVAVSSPTQQALISDELSGEKVARIKAAIKQALDAGDESFLTRSGMPDARKLDKLVGEPVSGKERDLAWAELSAEAGVEPDHGHTV